MCPSVGTGEEFHFRVEEVWKQNRCQERTCTLVEIVGDEVEEIGIFDPSPPIPVKKDRNLGKIKQGHKQENIEKILGAVDHVVFIVFVKSETKGSAKRK
jgi:hypothetical protein